MCAFSVALLRMARILRQCNSMILIEFENFFIRDGVIIRSVVTGESIEYLYTFLFSVLIL